MLADFTLDASWLALLDEIARTEGLALAPAKLAAAVRALSDAYNAGAFAKSRTREALAARLLFSFPRDVPKMSCAAREVTFPTDRVLRVLDVGAGLGASTWGLVRLLASRGASGVVDVTMIDDDAAALALAKRIVDAKKMEGAIDLRLTTIAERARSDRKWPARFDVVLVGQALGEIDASDDAEAGLLRGLVTSALAPDGALVVVEPALRDRTRRLHRVRDALAKSGVTIFAPCLHAAPCPMLHDESDWCHEDVAIDLPHDVAKIARAAGLRWQGLTFSYLVLRRDERTLRARVPSGSKRVVALPLVTKGKRELFLCADGEMRRVTRLDRDGEKRDAWSSAARGDVLAFAPPLEADDDRVTRETGVRIERTDG